MSLVWHIVQKDFRRMALAVGSWLVFVIGSTAGFRLATLGSEGNGPAEIGAWIATMNIWTRLVVVGELLMGFLLAGALTLEDGLQGTNAFWMTRPIPGARLLTAKLIATALLFVVAPTGGTIAVWLASGFSLHDAWQAAVDFAAWQAAVMLPAAAVASLASTLAEFLFCSVGFIVALGAGFFVTMPYVQSVAAGVGHSRDILSLVGTVLTAVMVLVSQYLTRRTARTWRWVGLVFALGLAIRIAWPWDFWTSSGAPAGNPRPEASPEDRAAAITVRSIYRKDHFGNDLPWVMTVVAPWTKDRFYVPVVASLDGSYERFQAFNGWQKASERAMELSADQSPIMWRLQLAWPRASSWHAETAPRFSGKLEIWSARTRVLGEMPLHVGGEFSNGATRARIVGLQRTGKQLDGIFIEEHDAAQAELGRLRLHSRSRSPGAENCYDCYFLSDRTHRRVQWLSESDLGAVNMNALSTSVVRLFVGGTESWDGANVVMVRIERDHAFTQPFSVQATIYDADEVTP